MKKKKLVVPSKIRPNPSVVLEETEIAAHITLPAEGGWGWVVVLASFMSTFIIDGVFFTFGSIYKDIIDDLQVQDTFVALINSIAVALYFISGPVVSGLINRFGFRACSMAGAVILHFAFILSSFVTNYLALLLLYGVIAGFGACLVSMSAGIIVGFYFERFRAMALAIAGGGSSVGIMIMFSVNSYLTNLAGWRVTTLIHAALFGTIYFIAMAFRPLLSLTITKGTEDTTHTTVTYLPSLATTQSSVSTSGFKKEGMATTTQRIFGAISNSTYPTATTIMEEAVMPQSPSPDAGPSTASTSPSNLVLTAQAPQGGISERQQKQVQSIMSRASVLDKDMKVKVEVPKSKDKRRDNKRPQGRDPQTSQPKKRSWWARLCHWEEHIPESRPMYRDDAFYEGNLENLPVYQKSTMNVHPDERTGLEYQMAVTRAVTTVDLKESKGLYTTAIRRILVTMMDPKLLKRNSFLLLSCSGFLTYVGLLIPYVFLPDRNKTYGIDPKHCNLFVSVIGFANGIGRLLSGALASKYSPIKVYLIGNMLAGVGTTAYNFSISLYFQYSCCIFFGMFIAFASSLRSVVLVQLYGLDKLTNATGMLLLFEGFGNLFSTPLSSMLKNIFGYAVSFYVAGIVIMLSGIILLPIQRLAVKENLARHTVTIK